MLCRVFHKAKAENSSNNNILSPQNTYEVGVVSSPNNNMDQYHALPFGGYRPNMAATAVSQRPLHQSQKLFDLMEPESNQSSYTRLPQEMNKAPSNDQIAEDEYGFLLDMNFEDPSLQDEGVHSSIEDLTFDNDNSLVFI